MRSKWVKPAAFVVILLAVFAFDRAFGWSASLGGFEGMAATISEAVEGNLAGAIALYCVATIVGCSLLALPGIVFALVAGACFGPVLGTAACVAACTVGAMASFLIGRFFLRDSVKPLAMKNRTLAKWLFDNPGERAVVVLAVTRLVPVFPYNLQNFAYGVTDVSFGTYSACTFLFMIPGTALYTCAGAGITDGENRWVLFAVAVAIAGVVAALGAALKRRYLGDGEGSKEEPTVPKNASYRLLVLEKERYLFKNYRAATSGAVLFLGCSFPSLYPETSRKLVRLADEREGMGVVLDCCGKPLADVGLRGRADAAAARLAKRLRKRGVDEIVTVCPNCFYFLRDRLAAEGIRVTNVYDRLAAWGCAAPRKDREAGPEGEGASVAAAGEAGAASGSSPLRVFVPCPDRRSREVYERMAPLLVEAAEPYASTCCGLGFGIPQRDPDRSRAMAERACADAHADEVCTYCASCSGALGRIGSVRVRHALTIILGTNEDPDIAHSLANRARAAVRRRPFA